MKCMEKLHIGRNSLQSCILVIHISLSKLMKEIYVHSLCLSDLAKFMFAVELWRHKQLVTSALPGYL